MGHHCEGRVCLENVTTLGHADGLEDVRVDHQHEPEARVHPARAAQRQLRAVPEALEEQRLHFLQVLLAPHVHRPSATGSCCEAKRPLTHACMRFPSLGHAVFWRGIWLTLRESWLPITHACLRITVTFRGLQRHLATLRES